MMWTLIQNQRVISQNGRTLEATIQSLELQKVATSNAISQLQIEEETRLNPELECGYNPFGSIFIFRNVGTMPAENIFLRTTVFCVCSNEVLGLTPISSESGTIIPPLDKRIVLPGEIANANKIYSPDSQWVEELWKKYGGEILVRIYVTYERSKPTYNRYSGYYYFTMNSTAEIGAQSQKCYQMFLTEEESPLIKNTLAQFNAMPRDRFKMVAYWGSTNMQEFPFGPGDFGVNAMYTGNTNGAILGSWAKHH